MSALENPYVRKAAIRWTGGTALPDSPQGSAMPLLVDGTTGRLMVDALTASGADLSIIQGKQDTTNGILTPQAANVALIKSSAASLAGFSIPAYDYLSLGYDGSGNLTSVVYKTGGSGGTTVGTLTLGYTSGNLTSVTKS